MSLTPAEMRAALEGIQASNDETITLIAAALARVEDTNPPPGPGGVPAPPVPWIWPVGDTPQVDKIYTDTFWTQRSPTYFHEGVDIRARNGRPILAVAPGVIARASLWNGTKVRWDAYGNHVVLCVDFTDYCVLFAHMKSLSVQTGRRVEQGQVLGISGVTGNADAEHLHFHVTHPSGRVGVFGQFVIDPAPLLPPAGQR